jgi:hypothetical protein
MFRSLVIGVVKEAWTNCHSRVVAEQGVKRKRIVEGWVTGKDGTMAPTLRVEWRYIILGIRKYRYLRRIKSGKRQPYMSMEREIKTAGEFKL